MKFPPYLQVIIVALLALGSFSCRSAESISESPYVATTYSLSESPLILVSIDGYRWDYTDLYNPPTIDSLANSGVVADGLIPPFPSKTFPSHFTQVTGLYPANHGIVSNTIYDPDMDAWFRLSDNDAQKNPAWWDGEPIWVTARKNNLIAACMFWPGSETPHDGILPDYFKPFDQSLTSAQRVDQLLEWMSLPSDRRPQFATLYFDIVDSAGHRHGPESDEVAATVAEVDLALGRLMKGLAKSGVTNPNIVIVSDHGMAPIDTSRVIFLDDYVDMTDVEIIDWSPIAALRTDDVDALYSGLKDKHPKLSVYHGGVDGDLPERFHFTGSNRIQPIIAVAEPGWTITIRDGYRAYRHLGATHGYDNMDQSMHGVFVASGPAFKKNARFEATESIHLYNMLSLILGVQPAPNDGSNLLIERALADTEM